MDDTWICTEINIRIFDEHFLLVKKSVEYSIMKVGF